MMVDCELLESHWKVNEHRVNGIAAMTGLEREMRAADSERLESARDAIKFELGQADRSVRWVGRPAK